MKKIVLIGIMVSMSVHSVAIGYTPLKKCIKESPGTFSNFQTSAYEWMADAPEGLYRGLWICSTTPPGTIAIGSAPSGQLTQSSTGTSYCYYRVLHPVRSTWLYTQTYTNYVLCNSHCGTSVSLYFRNTFDNILSNMMF